MKKVMIGIGRFFKKHVKGIVVLAILIAVVAIVFGRTANKGSNYSVDTAKLRDIANYNSFVGNVAYAEEKSVLPKVNAQITEVKVEIGDRVSEGDVIAILDSELIENSIEEAEIGLDIQKKANEHTLADANRAYSDLKYTLDNGLNATVNNVRIQKENAEDMLADLKEDYEEYIDDLTEYPKTKEAIYVSDAKKKYDDELEKYVDLKAFVDSIQDENTRLSYAEILNSLEENVDFLYEDYQRILDNYIELYDPMLEQLTDALEDAEKACKNANDAYESVKLQFEQQLINLEATIEKLNDTLSLESAEKKLEQLKDTLDDYTIKAPCDGVITYLNLKEGGMAVAGQPAVTVSVLEDLEIAIKVDEYSVLGATEGKEVKIFIDAIDREYEGIITHIADKATVVSGVSYFEATVEFTADEYVRGGMSVEVRLVRAESNQTVSLLASAVDYRDDNTAFVLVKDEKGEFVERDVVLGISDGIYVEIIEGVSNGEEVYYVPGNGLFMFPEMEGANVR